MYERTLALIGEDSLNKIKRKNILVLGTGGVGGYAIETLVRSGIQNITIVDYDKIDYSNINRQVIANSNNIGNYKVNEWEKRIKEIIKDISLKIDGRFTAITGPNGGGKSTLLRILSGVFDADSGEVKIDGQNIYNNPSVKGECFFIPDFPYFSNSATLENTAYLYRSLYPNWNENAFRQFCSVFPIDPDAKIIDMSKGMQRQAALILAISTCPRYLLLDEIFDGLDPVVRRLVKKILIDKLKCRIQYTKRLTMEFALHISINV